MFRNTLAFGGTLLVAAALVFLTPGASLAQRGGGFHGGVRGGFYGSGFHFGGYGGAYPGGYHVRPHYGNYHPGWYHHHPYYGAYHHGSHHYRPYYWGYGGYYPYSYTYYPYSAYSAYPSAGYSQYANPYQSWGSGSDSGYSSYSYQPAPLVTDAGTPIGVSAQVTVTVPANAKVWFDGTPTSSTGTVRQYTTPPLTPGRQYTYWARARWNENGREMNQLQPVEVTAGIQVNVTFPAPRWAGG
jgi:uncharacterized protein (TIGR03000 family)